MKIFKDKTKKQTLLSLLLFVVVIALYIELNILIAKLNLPNIDVTSDKIYTISEESKSKISKIDKDVKIQLYNFEGYENYTIVNDVITLIKQYENINNRITVQLGENNNEEEVVSKYPYIIVSSVANEKVISLDYLVSYKYNTDYGYEEEYYLSEELLTNSIINSIENSSNKVYFYLEKSVYRNSNVFTSIINRMDSLGISVDLLNLSDNSSIPDDCKCIIIPPLGQELLNEENKSTDISDEEKNAIVEYIKKGGNIMFLQESKSLMESETPNLDYIMNLYGIGISDGIVIEKDKRIQNNPGSIYADINLNSEVFKFINSDSRLSMFEASKINLENEEKLKELEVTYEVLATASDSAYLRKDLSDYNVNISDSDVSASGAILGVCSKKTIDGITSKAIMYSNSVFAVNSPIYLNDSITSKKIGVDMVLINDNEDIIANSIRYLVDNEDTIVSRKAHYDLVPSSNLVTDGITLKIVFIIPMIILFIGYAVWRHRKNKK